MSPVSQQISTKQPESAQTSINRAYSFADLSEYSPTERLIIRTAALLFYLIIRVVGRTTRFRSEGEEHLKALEGDGYLPIFNTWHNYSFLAIYWLKNRGIVVLTSKSFDGEYISRLLQRFGFGAVRGSSTRGGATAIVTMARLMRAGRPVAVTPDGPRGPRCEVKMGSVLLAKKTGHPIVPFTVAPARFWQLPSWDAFRLPIPFTRATIRVASPIFVPRDADDVALEVKRKEVQRALEQISDHD